MPLLFYYYCVAVSSFFNLFLISGSGELLPFFILHNVTRFETDLCVCVCVFTRLVTFIIIAVYKCYTKQHISCNMCGDFVVVSVHAVVVATLLLVLCAVCLFRLIFFWLPGRYGRSIGVDHKFDRISEPKNCSAFCLTFIRNRNRFFSVEVI